MKMLSTGVPSTLKNWYDLSATLFGANSAPTKFIKDSMDKYGEDQEVVADESQLLSLLGRMFVAEYDSKNTQR